MTAKPTIVPNVARSWTWNDTFTAVTFELRKGHKWSDGSPFGPDDVVFYFENIVNDPDLSPNPTQEWGKNARAKKIDDTHVEIIKTTGDGLLADPQRNGRQQLVRRLSGDLQQGKPGRVRPEVAAPITG